QVIYKCPVDIIPPIVSEELWDKANEILSVAAQVAVVGQTANMGEGADTSASTLGLPTNGASTIEYKKTSKKIEITGVEDGIANAINSIVGGTASACSDTGDGETTTCTLEMTNGRLTGTSPITPES
ncbi:MAG: hypothetical protein IKY98_00055, partial [Alphaproteobacteria bacterium]|nr:hypothetical protein [Alphaproteobacteria bacterium]